MSLRERRRLSRHSICYWIRKHLPALELSVSPQTRPHSWKLSLPVSETPLLLRVHEKYQVSKLLRFSSSVLQSPSVTPAFMTCWISCFHFFHTFLFIDFFVLEYRCLLFWLSSSSWLTFSLLISSLYCMLAQVKPWGVRRIQLWSFYYAWG